MRSRYLHCSFVASWVFEDVSCRQSRWKEHTMINLIMHKFTCAKYIKDSKVKNQPKKITNTVEPEIRLRYEVEQEAALLLRAGR